MLEAGAWEDSTFSLMVHPSIGPEYSAAGATTQSFDRFRATFTGRAAHAAAVPQHGVNAGSAATIAPVAIGLLRQHLPDGARVNAFVAHGGDVTNVIPATAVVEIEVRSTDLDELRAMKRRGVDCLDAGALATGCTVATQRTEPCYAGLRNDPALAALWDDNLAARGRTVDSSPRRPVVPPTWATCPSSCWRSMRW